MSSDRVQPPTQPRHWQQSPSELPRSRQGGTTFQGTLLALSEATVGVLEAREIVGAAPDLAQGRCFVKLIKWLPGGRWKDAWKEERWRGGFKYVQTFKYPMKPVKLLPQNNCTHALTLCTNTSVDTSSRISVLRRKDYTEGFDTVIA